MLQRGKEELKGDQDGEEEEEKIETEANIVVLESYKPLTNSQKCQLGFQLLTLRWVLN